MTMPGPQNQQPAQPVHTIQLPAPGYPMVTRMISDPLFPPDATAADKTEQPITWTVSHPHPLVPSMKLVRMFIESNGVAVYSVSDDGMTGMRNLIPLDRTRLVEEAMPLPVFVEELADAEEAAGPIDDNDDGDGDGDDDGDDTQDNAQSPPLQAVPSPTPSTTDPSPAAPSDGQPAS